MSIDRIKTAAAGPDFDPVPVVEYEYGEDDQATPLGQILAVPDTGTVESEILDAAAVRFQVTADCYYTIGEVVQADEADGGHTDILFAGVPYHEVVDPTHIISLKSVDGSAATVFIRPVKSVVND